VNPTHKTSFKGGLYSLPSQKDNFGLSKAEFQACVENLRNGDDSLITQNMVNQLQESMAYLQNKFSLPRQKSYDVCMNTLLQFRHKLVQDKIKYGNLRFLFTRMCANHFIDGEKRKKKTDEAIKVFLDVKSVEIDNEDFFLRLEHTINQLDSEQQLLIKDLYYSGKSIESIANERQITYASLRKKKERILKRIRKIYFQKSNI